MTAMRPASAAARAEAADVPAGSDDRFAGYGVMGLPFASGHVLAMRRFPASSIGPAYTSVWHRDPDGHWSFWQNQADDHSCPRYFADGQSGTKRVDVGLTWTGPADLRIVIPALDFEWIVAMRPTPATRVLTALGRAVPDRVWRSRAVLTAMSPVAATMLGAGRVSMVGTTPNGQDFMANPMRMWAIDASTARIGGVDFGAPGPLPVQARLGDFWIPQRGMFVVGRAFFSCPRHDSNVRHPV